MATIQKGLNIEKWVPFLIKSYFLGPIIWLITAITLILTIPYASQGLFTFF